MDISLNKYISDTGYCSRREADRLIEAGRVLLNNEVAVTGNRYRQGDEVVVDGSIVKPAAREKRLMLAFNKPPGITTTTDTDIRDNIISYINYPKRIFPIGRLDKDSEGLILLTNDGDIVNKILRAGNRHEKEYQVRVNRNIDGLFLKQMSEGVRIDGQKTLPCRVKQTGKHSFSIILVQGLNRQIRKMCEVLGFKVTFLQRTRIMHIRLDKLPLGKWRYLSEPEMDALYASVSASASAPVDMMRPGRRSAGAIPEHAVKASDHRQAGEGKGQGKKPAVSTKQGSGKAPKARKDDRAGKAVQAEKHTPEREGFGKKKAGSYRDFKRKGRG